MVNEKLINDNFLELIDIPFQIDGNQMTTLLKAFQNVLSDIFDYGDSFSGKYAFGASNWEFFFTNFYMEQNIITADYDSDNIPVINYVDFKKASDLIIKKMFTFMNKFTIKPC